MSLTMNTMPSTTPAHSAVTVGSSSTAALAANAHRKSALFINDSDETIYLSLGGTAAANTGVRLNSAGGSFEMSFAGKLEDSKLIGELTTSRGSQKVTGTKVIRRFRRRSTG